MARSHSIYVVKFLTDYLPLAGFTVKHELAAFLRGFLKHNPNCRQSDLRVYRMPDGFLGELTSMDVKELIND